MNQLLPFLILDLVVVVGVGVYYYRSASFFHPLTFYLFFHAYSFSFRMIELYGGKYPMYYGLYTTAYYSAIRAEEFIRAIVVADIALLLFLFGSKLAVTGIKPRQQRPHDDALITGILAIILPISAVLFLARRFDAAGISQTLDEYQFLNIIAIWPIACIALAIARWGLKWYWLVLALAYIALVATQGYHRFMALLPIVLLVGIYLARRQRRWPGAVAMSFLLVAALVFPTLKDLGRSLDERGIAGLSVLVQGRRDFETDLTSSRTEMFLDQFAGSLTLSDELERPLLGRTYLGLLTLPVPRSLWPDKPSLGETAKSVASAGRPFDVEGRIVTVLGESYINFRYAGIAVVIFSLGFFLTRYYLRAFSVAPVDSYKLAYLGLTTTYLQVFRDGLLSLVLFSIVVMFPLYLYAFLNKLRDRSRSEQITTLAGPTVAA